MVFFGFVSIGVNNDIVYEASQGLMQRLAMEAVKVATVSDSVIVLLFFLYSLFLSLSVVV